MRLAPVALLLALAAPAAAGPVTDAGTEAERLLSQNKPREALEALDRARDEIWKAMPLSFGRVMFVTAEPQGFGVYEPRAGNTFKAGESMVVYGEPMGYGFGRTGEMRRIEFDVAISVLLTNGDVAIAPQSGKLALQSRAENHEYMVSLGYEAKGLPAGEYVLLAEFKDLNSPKTGTIRLPFKIN